MPTIRKAAGSLAGLALFLAVALPGMAAQESSAAKRANVILIVADNQPARLLGAYGNDEIATPNIDALARSGTLCRNAFAASGVCSPARAALLTGLMPSQTGIHVALPPQPEVEGWSAIEEFRNLPQTLADAGYVTALVGKYHLGRHEEAQLGFSSWVTFPSGHTTTFYDQEVIDNGRRYRVEEHLTIENSAGRSFAALLEGAELEWGGTAFFEFVTVRMARTKRWKYMKRFDTDEPHTLFDLVNDPGEKRNLIDDPAHADVAEALDRRLTAFFARYSAPEYDLWNGAPAAFRDR